MAGLLDLIVPNQAKNAPARVSATAAAQTAQMAPVPSTVPAPNPDFDPTQVTHGGLTDEQTAAMSSPTPAATFGAGMNQASAMIKNAVAGAAQAVGAFDTEQAWRRSAGLDEAQAQRQMELSGSVNSLKDISTDNLFGDTANFLGHSIVRNAPQLGAMAVGSALTRGKGAFGQTLGTAAPSAVMNFGDAYGEGMDGVKTPEQRGAVLRNAALAAPVMAALDVGGFNTIFKAGTKKAITEAVTASLPAHIRRSILAEGVTEGVQEYIQQAAVKHALDNPDAFGIDKDTAWRLADAAAAGGAAGGAFAPIGHFGAPAAAASRMVSDRLINPAIDFAGRAASGQINPIQTVKDFVPDMSSTGKKAGEFVRNLVDGDPQQAGAAAMEALSNIPGLGSAIEQGSDFLSELRKSKRVARAEAAWGNAEEALQRGFENFYTGFTEQIDPVKAQEAYARYKEIVAQAMPIDGATAQGAGEKLAAALNGFNSALAKNGPAVASILGDTIQTAKNVGSAAADVGAMAAPAAGLAATAAAKGARVASGMVAGATDAARSSLKDAGGWRGVGEQVKEAAGEAYDQAKTAYDDAVAEVVGRYRTGKATAEDVAKTVATYYGEDDSPLSKGEAEREAATGTKLLRDITGEAEGKKSVVASSDAKLIASVLQQLAPNLSRDSARVQARVFEALVNNPAKMQEFLQHPHANTFTSSLYNVRAQQLADILHSTLRDRSADTENDSLGYLGAPPGDSAFVRSTKPDVSGPARKLVSDDREEAYGNLGETKVDVGELDAPDTSLDAPGTSFESDPNAPQGVSAPVGPPNEQLRFMEKALYDPTDKERDRMPGSKQWVKVTKREIDANTGEVKREVAFDRKVNLADVGIAESKTGARTQASDAGLTLAQKKDRNFSEGLGRLFGEPVVDVDPKTGNKIEYTVQPAKQHTENGEVTAIPKEDLEGWLRPDSKVAANGRTLKEMEQDKPKPQLGLPSTPEYAARMYDKIEAAQKDGKKTEFLFNSMAGKLGKEAVKTLYNIRPEEPGERDRVDLRTEKNVAYGDDAGREHRTSTPQQRLEVVVRSTQGFIDAGAGLDSVDDFWHTRPLDQATMSAMDAAIRKNDPSLLPDLMQADVDPRVLLAVQMLPTEVIAHAGDDMVSTLNDVWESLSRPTEPHVDEGLAAESKDVKGPVKDSLDGTQITYATPKPGEGEALRAQATKDQKNRADRTSNLDKTGAPARSVVAAERERAPVPVSPKLWMDNPSLLGNIKVSYDVRVQDTGETATVTESAEAMVADLVRREDALKRLAECL